MIKHNEKYFPPAYNEDMSNTSDTIGEDKSGNSSRESIQIHGGDSEFTDASWKYKAVALITALFLSCN